MKKALKKSVAFLLALVCTFSAMVYTVPEAEAAYDYEKDIFYFLKHELGMNDAAACGIVANIERESDFNPNLYGDDGTSYGICQWHNVRFDNLKNFCSENGHDYTTVTGQLYFLRYELETSYPNMLSEILSVENTAEGAYAAGYSFCYNFERPSNREYKSQQRGELAKEYWEKYGVLGDITAQKMNSLPDDSSFSSAQSLEISWQAGEGEYNRNRLHIVKRYPDSVSFDWDTEQVIVKSLNTLSHTFERGSFSQGSYVMWVEPWHTSKQAAGPSSEPMIVEIYDELFYETETDIGGKVFDTTVDSGVDVSGWAVNSGRYPVEFYLSVDSSEGEQLTKVAREDVTASQKYAPFCCDEYVGYEVSLPLSDLSNGEHTLTVTAVSESVRRTVADFTFTVVNGHDHSFTDYVSNDDATYLKDGTKTAKCDLCNTTQTIPDEGTKKYLGTAADFTAKPADTTALLSWKAVEGATGYRLYVYSSGWKLFAITGETQYNVRALKPGREYSFAIKAYGETDEGSYRSPDYVTVSTVTHPSVPKKLVASSTADSVTLKWSVAAGATGYRVYVYNKSTKKWEKAVNSTTKTSTVIKNLSDCKKYTFAVKPYYKTDDKVIWAQSYIKITAITKLETAQIVASHSSAKGRVTISWSKVPYADGYQIWVSDSEDGTYKKVSNFDIRSTYLYGYKSGRTYYFKIRAYKKIEGGYLYSAYTPAAAIKIK